MQSILFNHQPITPSKIVCIGRNYVEHIHELNNEIPQKMVLFNKPNSAISDTLRYFGEDTRFEGEMAFLIFDNQIKGVGFGLDLTHADIQNQLKAKGLPWERAKSFDGSALFGEFVAFDGDLSHLSMELWINDQPIQYAHYELMIHKPLEIIHEISTFMHLEDGDIVMSGTPKGVGGYRKHDRFVGKILCKDRLLVQSQWEVH